MLLKTAIDLWNEGDIQMAKDRSTLTLFETLEEVEHPM